MNPALPQPQAWSLEYPVLTRMHTPCGKQLPHGAPVRHASRVRRR